MGRCRAWPSVICRLPCRLAHPPAVCLFVRSSHSFLQTQTDWHAVRCVCTPSALLVRTGLLSPLASQPFDTIKTKMQAEARYAKEGPVSVGRAILRTEGLAGMYRGMMPILLSTGVQKSALFAGYAGAKRWCDQSKIALLAAPLPSPVACPCSLRRSTSIPRDSARDFANGLMVRILRLSTWRS